MKHSRSSFTKYLSYLAGKHVLQTHSEVNDELNVYYLNGKYILHAKNTNYSFGELHKGFQKIFKKIRLAEKDFSSVLILGFGVGSVASILQEEMKKDCRITGIEKDPEIIALGEKYFDIDKFEKTEILLVDALEYVKSCQSGFDLVVFDIYLDNRIPPVFETETFLADMKTLVNPGGTLVFNKDVNNPDMLDSLESLQENIYTIFPNCQKIQVVKNNWFFVWENN